MTFPNLFRLYIWLIDTISRWNGGMTLEEINQKWVRTDISEGKPLSRSSFIRHKEEIADIFGINIICNRDNGYRYQLEDRDILHRDSVQNWIISTLSVSNVLNEGLSLNDRILLESIPSSKWIKDIIESMKRNEVVEMAYKKYGHDHASLYSIEPYCLKLFRRRWYLLALKRPDNEFRTFSLDRIESIGGTGERFAVARDFSGEEFFRNCYGIVHDTGMEVERVVIRAYGYEAKQIRDLPIHQSQRELPSESAEVAEFELTLRPTLDFISFLVGKGPWVKVLEPSWVRDQVAEIHRESLEMYAEEDEDE